MRWSCTPTLIVPALGVGLLLACSGTAPENSSPTAPLSSSEPASLAVSKSPGTPLNVLLISVDTLRSDHMSLYGYGRKTTPKIDTFFSQGVVFDRAYSTASNTTPSVFSFLTGQLPQRHRVRTAYQRIPPDLPTLARFLEQRGYQTAGIVSNLVLTAEATDLQTQFDYYDDFVDQKELYRNIYERGARPTTDAALKWFTSARKPEQPHFLWVHYMDPHGPYDPPDSKPVEFTHDEPLPVEEEKIPAYQYHPGVTDGREYIDRYDEEIAYADAEIGRLLQAYEENGLLDTTLFVFTADHGETLMERYRYFVHDFQVYEELIRVPLAIRAPGLRPGTRVSTPVSIVDIVPTILECAGLPVPEGLDGQSLLEPKEDRNLFAESTFPDRDEAQWRCVVRGAKKWMICVVSNPDKTVKHYRFYDLDNDPDEERSLRFARSEAARRLEALIEADEDIGCLTPIILKGEKIEAPKRASEEEEEAPGVNEETIEMMRSLGYVN